MSVRLESFEYLPRGADGWGSRPLRFGKVFTAVQGANGTGKTPIMKGLVQGLGHDVELPPDVLKSCAFARTTVTVDARPLVLTRRLGPEFEISVEDAGQGRVYRDQAKYAEWFCGLFAEEPPTLTTRQRRPSALYVTVLAPAISVDQDHGWTTDYWASPSRNFILNQRQEVIRFLVGVSPRHPFRERTTFDAAKEALGRVEKTIEMQRFIVERLRTAEGLSEQEEPRLVDEQNRLRYEMKANSGAIEAVRSATARYDREIDSLEAQQRGVAGRLEALEKQKRQLNLVFSELDGEEEILTANVQATDLLRQFCERQDCEMFAGSERSFGRSLLFLKDQIKDLRAADSALSRGTESLGMEVDRVQAELERKREERERALKASPQAEVVDKLNSIARELVNVELRLAKVRQYAAELERFERLLDRREQAIDAVAEARPTGVRTGGVVRDARQLLSDSIQEWLVTLGTQNTKSARFDEDFTLFVDDAKFATSTHQSGSTRTRIVLAFHAALLEVSLARGGNHPGWLLFDAPKQHELTQSDFDAYTQRLHMIAARYSGRVQVVFSVADLRTTLQSGDVVWKPDFIVDGEPRFLGPQGEEAASDGARV